MSTAVVGEVKMPKEDSPEKGPKTRICRLRVRTVEMLEDIAEASGEKVWQTVERLLGPGLPAEHRAVQPQLKKARDIKAKLAEVHQQARREHAG